jgi:penicillin-binding protein 2
MYLAPRSDLSEFRKRYKWMALVALLAMLTLLGRLFYLQVMEGDTYHQMAKNNIMRKATLATNRGVIRDGFGKILASSRPSHNAYLIPGRVMPSARVKKKGRKRVVPDTFNRVSEILRLTPEERTKYEAKIRDACQVDDDKGPCWKPILVREDIPRDIVAELRQHSVELPGTDVVPNPIRFYPFKNLGSHMLGYVSEIDRERLDRLRPEGYDQLSATEKQKVNPLGYDVGDHVGAIGLERAWESHLRGQRGWEKRIVDAHGRYRSKPEDRRLIDSPAQQEPIPGRDLRLTVDMDLMTAIDKAMRVHLSGAVVVVDVRTGRLLALYSKPDFDPNELSGSGGRARIREAVNRLWTDPLRPMLDKTMTGAFQPGSTFKPFSALAGLERKILTPMENAHCDGFINYAHRIFRCTHVHGRVNMREAIAQSCNVYFYELAKKLDLDPMASLANEFGLGQKTGIGVNPESPGNIPTQAWYTLRNRGQFYQGFTMNSAIGQGATTVTPLQLALSYAALGNGGTVYMPQLVRAIETPDGSVSQEFSPRVRQKTSVAKESIGVILDGLYAVVNNAHGTAYPVRDPSIEISGKTGTAQTGYVSNTRDDPKQAWYFARDHAWFAAFAPSKAPEIAVVVLVEHGGSGPTQAAPVAIQVVREYRRLQEIHAGRKPPELPPMPKLPNAGGHGGHH